MNRNRRAALRILALMATAIFVVEFGIMLLLFRDSPSAASLFYAFLDSTLLLIVLYPVLHLLVYRPLLLKIAEHEKAVELSDKLLKQVESERRLLESVVGNAPVGIALLRGASFVFEIVNPTYQAIAPGKVLIGRTVAEAWPELAEEVVPLLEHVLKTGESYSITEALFPVQRSPGLLSEEVYFTFKYVPLCEPDGQVYAILVLVIETTEQVHVRQRVEELAREGEQRSVELETIINSIADDVFVWDNERRIVDLNEAALQFLGLEKKEEAINLSADYLQKVNLRHLDGRPVAPEERGLARALRGELVRDFEQVALDVHSGQDIYLLTSAAPIHDSVGNIVGAVVVNGDITRLKELDKLKDGFLATAAHELKTPLTLMKGYSQALLRTGGDLSPARQKMLKGIDLGADRINKIVTELLDITWLQHGSLDLTIEKIDLPELVRLIVDQMALTIPKHQIQVVEADPVVVQGDRARLEQVLVHLIDNAARFSPSGGNIDVAVKVGDHEAVVSVRDYGVGIPADRRAHIFERFYRGHAGTPFDFGGMGVGLYISKEIIARHGGRMWFESKEGKGSTFNFSLPLAAEQGAARTEVKS